MNTTSIHLIGISWYSETDYPKLLKLFTDYQKLPTTYKKWLEAAQNTEQRLRIQHPNAILIRVPLTPAEFKQWCINEKVQPDAQARMRYANTMAYHIHTQTLKTTH